MTHRPGDARPQRVGKEEMGADVSQALAISPVAGETQQNEIRAPAHGGPRTAADAQGQERWRERQEASSSGRDPGKHLQIWVS